MKNIGFGILLTISLFLVSCNGNKKKKIDLNEAVKTKIVYPASNLNEDNYNPGENWTIDWSDEFKDSILSSDWSRQEYPQGNWNKEWQKYTASDENAYIDQGCLVIKAIHTSEVHDSLNYTSARLHTANHKVWKYGKIAARIQLPYGNGVWPAFWTLGANCDETGGDTPWPYCGEVDILETYGSKDDAVLECNIHYANENLTTQNKHGNMGSKSIKLDNGIFADAFHVFEIEWNEDRIVWKLDGKAYAQFGVSEDYLSEFHKEFYILLNLAIGGTPGQGMPDNSTVFPQYMYVDWVRVYKKV